ncbi:MAG: hypothetical protein GKR90_08865 [Pseudomonadales bacterium]|nr:hypothetical protein [Pseudomonadales bacterium]
MHIAPSIFRAAFIVGVLIASHAAADTERRDVNEFSEIAYSLPFDVEFVVSDEHFVELEGDEDTIDKIQTEIRGNKLKIYKQNSWFDWSNGSVVVTVGFEEVDAITMAGSGDGFAEVLEADEMTLKITGSANLEVETIDADEIYLSIAGSGNLEIHETNVDEVESRIAGSGDMELAGRAVSQEISISGSGDFRAPDLQTQETSASIRGSGNIVVWAEAHLSASVAGSGDIEYYGAPDVTERIRGSGDLIQISEDR